MSPETLISYAQNLEDIVLWRALGHVTQGVYVDVGGWDPDEDSVTRLFYDRGWRGVDVEPVPEFAEKFRVRRPRNDVVQAVITDREAGDIVLHRFGSTGLSTVDDEIAARHDDAGFERADITVPARRLDDVLAGSTAVGDVIHFLKIDVEGAEDQVLRSIDLDRWRPWVLVIEATEPNSTSTTHDRWEPLVLAAGYTFTLFDGLSRFYVSSDHPELVASLSYPACVLDDYVLESTRRQDARVAELGEELARASGDAIRWRNEAVSYWANAVAKVQKSDDAAKLAKGDAARSQRQLARVREKLRQATEDRKRLRARAQRLTRQLDRARQRNQRPLPPPPTLRGRLRGAAKRVARR